VEIHPSYRQDRHFRHAARMTGKIYMPMRSLKRESCVGSSDTITVPLDEFERTMDGALRIARYVLHGCVFVSGVHFSLSSGPVHTACDDACFIL